MRFFLFNSLLKLELAKYSLVLSLQALLFAVIVRGFNYRMTSQSSLATFQRNANHLYTFVRDTRISCNSKKVIFAIENETYVNDSPATTFETKLLLSLKTGVLIINPYLDERYFGKQFLISLLFGTCRTAEDLTREKKFPGENNTSKKMYLEQHESSQSHLKNSLCLVDEFPKDERDGDRKWATWKKSELAISYQSNHLSAQPSGLSEILIIAEKNFAKIESVPVKTVASDDGFIKGNKNPNIKRNEILKGNKTSAFESILDPILSSTKQDSICLKEEHTLYPSHCAVIEPQYPIANGYNIPKNANLRFEKVKPKQISPNSQDNPDRSKGEFETFKFIKVPKLPMAEKISKNLKIEKVKSEKKFSKLILSIMREDSNSDMQKLGDEVNFQANAATLFRSHKKSDLCHHWGYNKVFSCGDSLTYTPGKESCFTDYKFTNEKNKTSDISEGQYPMSKRTRVNSADSGVCLDSNFEETLQESPSRESNSYEDGTFPSCITGVSHEFVSGLNSSKPLYVEDCYKVCHLCKKDILKFFLSNRFGLLLNCFHSFCYSCIRNHCKSEKIGTGLVECPKCGENSPGIVSSPRWISDTYEKTILFQKYAKESKFFCQQQEVFFNLFSV